MYRLPIIFAVFLGFLTACQLPPVKNEFSVRRVPTGATLTVHEDIQLISGSNRALIQGGHLVETLEFGDLFFPHCIFEVNKPTAIPRLIRAGKYRVIRVKYRANTHIYQKLVHSSQVVVDGGGAFIDYLHVTELELSTPGQTDGFTLLCQHSDMIYADHLGVAQIRATLGSIASLELPVR